MHVVFALGHALWMAFAMLWQLFWGLSLGFLFSAVVEVMVSRGEMSKLLPDAAPRSILRASLFGAASSSCSYAAVAMARSLVRKGADFTAAMAFQFAATNLVLELGVLLWVLVSWQFAAAEFVGGPVMIVVLAVLFRLFLRDAPKRRAVERARGEARGKMEGHADMSMAPAGGAWTARIVSKEGWIAVSHHYMMNWAMLWRDIGTGLLVAGALAAWVPAAFWQRFFFVDHPALAMVWGAFVGPLIAVISFTCSVGNVPLAAVLWNGGISFGGVAAFIFGDLLIPPIVNIYRKYYGSRMTVFMVAVFYAAMVVASLAVELLFRALGWVPEHRHAAPVEMAIHFNYTAVLDLGFAGVFAVLAVVFLRTGGPDMMRMMNGGASGAHRHSHSHSHPHPHSHSREE
ncbi:permease [Paraburkholderia sp. J41]|uniref:permease n=1 Tax=Paraburkholderia sp. J41 TaxID=2805433 RepID=UPI002AC3658B|nr:permease [Paraburkholderia sp. J41]